jgi:hypothetical protein
MTRRLQVPVVVDVQGAVDAGELEALLPPARRDDRRIFSLRRDGGAPLVARRAPDAQPIDRAALGIFSFGTGLLEALRGGDPDLQARFASLLLLHEHQGIRSTDYFDIGRAGVELEAVDLAADVSALRVALAAAAQRRRGRTAPLAGEAALWIDAVLYGIQAFRSLAARFADRRARGSPSSPPPDLAPPAGACGDARRARRLRCDRLVARHGDHRRACAGERAPRSPLRSAGRERDPIDGAIRLDRRPADPPRDAVHPRREPTTLAPGAREAGGLPSTMLLGSAYDGGSSAERPPRPWSVAPYRVATE